MRRRIVVLTTATTLLVVVAFFVPLALLLDNLATNRAIADATQEAQGVAVLAVVADTDQLRSAVELLNQRTPRRTGLHLPDGTVLGAADTAPAENLSLARAGRSFTVTVDEGREVYVPVDTATGRVVVHTYVPESLLHRGLWPSILMLAALSGTLLVVAVLVADRLAVSSVRPLRRLAETAEALSAGDLTARADLDGPREAIELAYALNLLAARIDELLEAEREVVADLSHRLRTPLTALRLDGEGVTDPVQSARLVAHVDALQRVVDEVIEEARRPVREGLPVGCDVVDVVRTKVEFWSVLLEEQGRRYELVLPHTAVRVRTTDRDLGAALDALLQNLLAHTAAGVGLRLEVTALPEGGAVVQLDDEGDGYPAEALQRGWSAAGSTGLGLDIARRTAEASGGRLEVATNDRGGARTVLVLGPAPALGDAAGVSRRPARTPEAPATRTAPSRRRRPGGAASP